MSNELDLQSIVSKNLKYIRDEYNITQKELATIMGISPTSMQKYEYGERTPDISNLFQLCRKYNILLDTFVSKELNNASLNKKLINGLITYTYNKDTKWNKLISNVEDPELFSFFNKNDYVLDCHPSFNNYTLDFGIALYKSYVNNKNICIVETWTCDTNSKSSYLLFLQTGTDVNSYQYITNDKNDDELLKLVDIIETYIKDNSYNDKVVNYIESFLSMVAEESASYEVPKRSVRKLPPRKIKTSQVEDEEEEDEE
jgi:transcriptional regulator with XRE-family HTH domain